MRKTSKNALYALFHYQISFHEFSFVSGPNKPRILWAPGIKRHKNERKYTSVSPVCRHGVHSGNLVRFTFTTYVFTETHTLLGDLLSFNQVY